MEKKNVWNSYSEEQLKEVEAFAREYMDFLDAGKTERECVDTLVNLIEKEGYVELNALLESGSKIKPGDKIYAVNMNKCLVMYQIGKKPMKEGMNILGAHIDSPRLDVKQNPVYEDSSIAYLDTHYYGGVKKYQWVAIPLSLHGVVVKKDGTTVEINVGDNEDDPVFFISDLLVHLAGEQMEKKAAKVIEGEALDLIVGNIPVKDKDKDAVTAGVLNILKESYGIEEQDFLSAELEIVPAGKAREAGFDRSMILAYGQDDRVCAYTSARAVLEVAGEVTDRTACCILVDKEEIGSVGATGMQSRFFENMTAELMELMGEYSELNLRRCLSNSTMLSSDVSAGYDPSYASCFEKKNSAFMGDGMVFNKFTGVRGKSGSNDANAEYMAHIREIMDSSDVVFQTAELGKVDVGGGLLHARVLEVVEEGNRLIQFQYQGIWEEVLDQLGEMPLPPYITHKLQDKNRYQTVYAKYEGSAAAPTAGLHFTTELLQELEQKGVDIAYVTLHVGLGTFRPVKVDNLKEHHMHSEYYQVTREAADKINKAKENGHRVVCVGTTSCRTVESACDENGHMEECCDNTEIFIYPGYRFKVLDALITNFHLPESTLVMLVSALAGREHVLAAYEEAVKEKYRFFSFGDAMLIK